MSSWREDWRNEIEKVPVDWFKRAHMNQGRDFEIFPESQRIPDGGRSAIDAAKHISSEALDLGDEAL